MTVRARVREMMAKIKMEVRDGAKAMEMGAKAASEKEMLVRVAKVWEAKVGEKETEAKEESRER